jgi:TPR repeat protein
MIRIDGRIAVYLVDIAAAHQWYRKSAEAGDFPGQRSLAAVLLEAGRAAEADYDCIAQ